jgi:hypothetical protein
MTERERIYAVNARFSALCGRIKATSTREQRREAYEAMTGLSEYEIDTLFEGVAVRAAKGQWPSAVEWKCEVDCVKKRRSQDVRLRQILAALYCDPSEATTDEDWDSFWESLRDKRVCK